MYVFAWKYKAKLSVMTAAAAAFEQALRYLPEQLLSQAIFSICDSCRLCNTYCLKSPPPVGKTIAAKSQWLAILLFSQTLDQWFPNLFCRAHNFKCPQSHYHIHPNTYKEMYKDMCHKIVFSFQAETLLIRVRAIRSSYSYEMLSTSGKFSIWP